MVSRIDHPRWDPSWAVPSEETIDDLGELGLLRVEPPFNKVRVFSLTMKGRDKAKDLFAEVHAANAVVEPYARIAGTLGEGEDQDQVSRTGGGSDPRDPRKVAVMHGRDLEAKRWMFDWLRRVGLEPLEWNQLVDLTGKAAPYNGEAVAAAFTTAQAVVILLTPDDVGMLHPELLGSSERADPFVGQPRLNVVLEAGMALQSHMSHTVLVEIGRSREISDLAGRNTIRLDGSPSGLNDLASRLAGAGCKVQRTGSDWLDTSGLEGLSAHAREASERVERHLGGIAATGVQGGTYRSFRVHDLGVEERMHDDSGWSAWSEIGSVRKPVVDLAASSLGSGHAEIFALLEDGEVVHNWWKEDYGWNGVFRSLGQPFGQDPISRITAATKRSGHQEVFVEARNGEVGHIWFFQSRWHHNKDPSTKLNDGWWRF